MKQKHSQDANISLVPDHASIYKNIVYVMQQNKTTF